MMTMKNTPRRASRGFRIIFATTVVGCILMGAISAGATPSKATKKHSDRSRRVVLFSLPRVTWSTLQTATTPNIDKLISRGSVAAMSVRTLGVVTTPAEGYATISAGNRAAAVDSSQTSFLSPTETFDGDIAKAFIAMREGFHQLKILRLWVWVLNFRCAPMLGDFSNPKSVRLPMRCITIINLLRYLVIQILAPLTSRAVLKELLGILLPIHKALCEKAIFREIF